MYNLKVNNKDIDLLPKKINKDFDDINELKTYLTDYVVNNILCSISPVTLKRKSNKFKSNLKELGNYMLGLVFSSMFSAFKQFEKEIESAKTIDDIDNAIYELLEDDNDGFGKPLKENISIIVIENN